MYPFFVRPKKKGAPFAQHQDFHVSTLSGTVLREEVLPQQVSEPRIEEAGRGLLRKTEGTSQGLKKNKDKEVRNIMDVNIDEKK